MPLIRRLCLINLYGSTEVAGDVSYYAIDASRELLHWKNIVSLGKPIANANVRVCGFEDITFEQLPDLEEGELVVSGKCLSNGYTSGPSSNFCKKSLADGSETLFYRTGDRGISKSGQLYYLGRSDNLIKLNGVRISLEELQATIASELSLAQTDVVASFHHGRLEVYVRCKLDDKALRDSIATALPREQRPHHVRSVSSFPTTATGKIDRFALKRKHNATKSKLSDDFPTMVRRNIGHQRRKHRSNSS